jgi:hypothetical protein
MRSLRLAEMAAAEFDEALAGQGRSKMFSDPNSFKAGKLDFDALKESVNQRNGVAMWYIDKLLNEGYSKIYALDVKEVSGKKSFGDDEAYVKALAAKDGDYFKIDLHSWDRWRPSNYDSGTEITNVTKIPKSNFDTLIRKSKREDTAEYFKKRQHREEESASALEAQKQIQTIENKRREYLLQKARPCPKCEKMMVLRFNSKDRKPFWGCSAYPNCKGTRSLGSQVMAKYLQFERKIKAVTAA